AAASMKPRSGANAPDVISSRSPSWASPSVQDGQPDSSAGRSRSAGGAAEAGSDGAGVEAGELHCVVSCASEHDSCGGTPGRTTVVNHVRLTIRNLCHARSGKTDMPRDSASHNSREALLWLSYHVSTSS